MKCWLPNLQKIASIGLTLPVSTATVERSFSQMKLIKTRLRNSLTEGRLTQLMRIAMEPPDQLREDEIEVILDNWNRKPRRISIFFGGGGGGGEGRGGECPSLAHP